MQTQAATMTSPSTTTTAPRKARRTRRLSPATLARHAAAARRWDAAIAQIVAYLKGRGFVGEKELVRRFPDIEDAHGVFELCAESASGAPYIDLVTHDLAFRPPALDALITGGRWHFALPGTERGEV